MQKKFYLYKICLINNKIKSIIYLEHMFVFIMRDILHVDLNNFYASCECLVDSSIRNLPVAVCGSQAERHGIVLAKNYFAKNFGVSTGQTIWQAKKLCPNLVVREPNFDLYMTYSQKVRQILLSYTDLVEPFGIDESWVDVTDSKVFGTPLEIAEEIRARVLRETGLTVSVGVSFNKIFAKLGSDLKKPNAVTQITMQNYKQLVWPLPINDLLMIGRQTAKKLNLMGVFTIGQLAAIDKNFLHQKFGKNGDMLFEYANGIGNDVVKNFYHLDPPKSIGNSTTCYKDLKTNSEVMQVILTVSTSVVERMIESGYTFAKTIKLWFKDNSLQTYGKQCKLKDSTLSQISKTAYKMFVEMYDWHLPIRSVGVSVCDFYDGTKQLDLFSANTEQKQQKLDKTILEIKEKFGEYAIQNGSALNDKRLSKHLHGLGSIKNK